MFFVCKCWDVVIVIFLLVLAETQSVVVFEHGGAQRKQWEGDGQPLVALLQEKELQTQTYSGDDPGAETRIVFSSGQSIGSNTQDAATSDQKEGIYVMTMFTQLMITLSFKENCH